MTMYKLDVKGNLSDRIRGHGEGLRESHTWPELSENDLLLRMQKKMTGLDTKQKKIIKEYEQELEAMKNEIKKIRSDYDGLKQKNTRYRHTLKEKNDLVKKLQEEHSRASRIKHTYSDGSWSTEKTKLMARIKQLEVEKKQVEEQYSGLVTMKQENVDLKRELESLRFKETLWHQEKDVMERKLKDNKNDYNHRKSSHKEFLESSHLKSLDFTIGGTSELNFDQAWEHITNSTHVPMTSSDRPFSSLPPMHALPDYKESTDLQDIRKSLNEAREELIMVKDDSQSKKNQFLEELMEREKLQTTVHVLKSQANADTTEVRQKITSLDAKITNLESNCLMEVRNLVSNVDILKKELINSQQELQALKEYSRQMEQRREQEKIQMLNESRELKLDLSSLRTEIRDKSQGSDRTDLSRGAHSDRRDAASDENFDSHYSPLVGYVGSRCDYLKMKLDTLKKHLKNLHIQTQSVLTHSIVDGQGGQETSSPGGQGKPGNSLKDPNTSGQNKTKSKRRDKGRRETLVSGTLQEGDEDEDGGEDDGDEDDIVVLTPRPHRNKFDQEMDMLIVENGQNIERLRLPSLEEEDDEDADGDTSRNLSTGRFGDNSQELTARSQCSSRRVMESPRYSGRHSARTEEGEELDAVRSFLAGEESKTRSLVQQVDDRFERLERELALQNRRRNIRGPGPMQANHNLLPKSAH